MLTRVLIAWMSFAAGSIFITADIIRLRITGLALLGAVLLIIWVWLLDGFRRESWIQTITEDHPDALGSLDIAERAHRQEQSNGTDIQR